MPGADDLSAEPFCVSPRWFWCSRCGLGALLAVGCGSITCPVCSVIDGGGYAGHPADNDHLRDGGRLSFRGPMWPGRALYEPKHRTRPANEHREAALLAASEMDRRWPEGASSAEGRGIARSLSAALALYAEELSRPRPLSYEQCTPAPLPGEMEALDVDALLACAAEGAPDVAHTATDRETGQVWTDVPAGARCRVLCRMASGGVPYDEWASLPDTTVAEAEKGPWPVAMMGTWLGFRAFDLGIAETRAGVARRLLGAGRPCLHIARRLACSDGCRASKREGVARDHGDPTNDFLRGACVHCGAAIFWRCDGCDAWVDPPGRR